MGEMMQRAGAEMQLASSYGLVGNMEGKGNYQVVTQDMQCPLLGRGLCWIGSIPKSRALQSPSLGCRAKQAIVFKVLIAVVPKGERSWLLCWERR